MVIKGKSVGSSRAAAMPNYLLNDPKNERADLIELRGTAAVSLHEAIDEWRAVASGTRCQNWLYSASINPQAHEKLTREQYIRAADILAEKLRLQDQPRAIVIQSHEGREHAHVLFSRIDIDRMRAIPDGHNFRAHEAAARHLEREFGLERIQGAHVERDGQPRPDRAPTFGERKQAERGVPLEDARALITGLWTSCECGRAFNAALHQKGWHLCQGDRRDYVLVDPHGCLHGIARRAGVKAHDVREKLSDLDRSQLPTVKDVRGMQREARVREHHERRHQIAPIQNDGRGIETPMQAAEKSGNHPLRALAALTEPVLEGQAIAVPEIATARLANGILRTAEKLFDSAATFFEGLLGGGPTKPQQPLQEKPLTMTEPTAPTPELTAQRDREADQQDRMRRLGADIPQEASQWAEMLRDQRERDDGGGRSR